MADTVLVAAAASQLRLIQADCADDSPTTRQQRLMDVLRQYLEKLLPQDRQSFLEELQERFPIYEQAASTEAPAAVEQGTQDPLALAQQLIESLKNAPAEDRREVADLLRDAGLGPAPKQDSFEPLAQRLRQMLQLAPTDTIDSNNLAEVTALLIDFAAQLDPFAWKTWRGITPRAVFPRGKLKDVIRNYIKGQRDASAASDLTSLRKLTIGLLNAISYAPTEFYQEHLALFAPIAIDQAVVAQGTRFFGNRDAQCWQKYKELAIGLDRTAVEKAFAAAVYRLVVEPAPELVNKES